MSAQQTITALAAKIDRLEEQKSDLLEALQDCLIFTEKRHGYMCQKAQQARAAIAKATNA